MIIGYDFFDGSCFDTIIPMGNIYNIEISKINLDTIKIDESTHAPFSTDKEDWGYDTVLLCDFANSLESSNLNNSGLPITNIKVKKRRKNELTWQDVYTFDFDKNEQYYSFEDRLVEALEDYEYALQPVGEGGVLGGEKIQSVSCDFEGLWLVSPTTQYQFLYNLELEDMNNVRKLTLVEPIGGQYPIVSINGNLKYKRTIVKAMLVSKNSENGTIDRKAEKTLRKNIEEFLTDGKAKIMKESSGTFILAMVLPESVKLKPINELGQQMYNIEFELVEIGSTSNTDLLKKLGFIK